MHIVFGILAIECCVALMIYFFENEEEPRSLPSRRCEEDGDYYDDPEGASAIVVLEPELSSSPLGGQNSRRFSQGTAHETSLC